MVKGLDITVVSDENITYAKYIIYAKSNTLNSQALIPYISA